MGRELVPEVTGSEQGRPGSGGAPLGAVPAGAAAPFRASVAPAAGAERGRRPPGWKPPCSVFRFGSAASTAGGGGVGAGGGGGRPREGLGSQNARWPFPKPTPASCPKLQGSFFSAVRKN